MKARLIIIIALLGAIIGLPLLLKRESETASPATADDRLVIISPHNESIRREFGEAFAAYWKREKDRSIYVDWRTPGGTSEIRMVLDAGFKAAEETGRQGIGVDLFFGGGEPDFSGQAKLGRFVPLDIFGRKPELFGDGKPVPEVFSGERFYAEDKVWVGTCISQFGICYNPDFIKRLGISAPGRWQDLGDKGYAGTLALADPSKSGSVARTFELIVQGEMQAARSRGDSLEKGWDEGLQLIQRMAANARYFTDSASKIPQDVGQGNAAAGMSIDFYGRSYASELSTREGRPRVVWIAPKGGTTMSADPIAVLKGAPHPIIAQEFVGFCMSEEAQKLWFLLPGSDGGPVRRALHRSPIRRDVYDDQTMPLTTMPDVRPYEGDANFIYEKELTGKVFNTLRQLVKVMCIDSHEEMKSAWQAMIAAGMPDEAMAVFQDVSNVSYRIAGQGDPGLDSRDPMIQAARMHELGEMFRANYQQAEKIAESVTKRPLK
ncbi:ABC transporter substrate-binding protein [Luteolibacter algae]|uniref:ABC transporter substrate-binding protein n=1 Tax=Luteolibacter algae TaxID=454151 RepID=A0ABW5DDG3_9BACT